MKNKILKIASFSVAVIFTFSVAAYNLIPGFTFRSMSSHRLFQSADELESACDIVVIGTIEKKPEEYKAILNYGKDDKTNLSSYSTLVDIKPIKYIKGKTNLNYIPTHVKYAYVDAFYKKQRDLFVSESSIIPEKGKTYLFFIAKQGNEYGIMSINQGIYELDDPNIDQYESFKDASNIQYEYLREKVFEKYGQDLKKDMKKEYIKKNISKDSLK